MKNHLYLTLFQWPLVIPCLFSASTTDKIIWWWASFSIWLNLYNYMGQLIFLSSCSAVSSLHSLHFFFSTSRTAYSQLQVTATSYSSPELFQQAVTFPGKMNCSGLGDVHSCSLLVPGRNKIQGIYSHAVNTTVEWWTRGSNFYGLYKISCRSPFPWYFPSHMHIWNFNFFFSITFWKVSHNRMIFPGWSKQTNKFERDQNNQAEWKILSKGNNSIRPKIKVVLPGKITFGPM